MSVGDAKVTRPLEQRWHREMLDIFQTARSIGYEAHRFIQMVGEPVHLRPDTT